KNNARVIVSDTDAAIAVDAPARANARQGTGNSAETFIISPSPNIALASSTVVATSATSSTPGPSTPVVRTPAAITKPVTNHGTSGVAPLSAAFSPDRSRRFAAMNANSRRYTRPSFIVVA